MVLAEEECFNMPYFAGSPWTDAASYGQGLGQSLGQAMLQMPQQRYELAAQQAQMRATQQRNMLELALQNRAQQSQQQLGMSELNLHQQELIHNQQYHNQEVALLQQKAQNAAKGTWRTGETKGGVPYQENTTTGEFKWVPQPDAGQPPTDPKTTAEQLRQAQIEAAKMVGGFSALVGQDGFQKNQPALYSQGTNIIGTLAPYLLKSLTNTLGQAQSSVPGVPGAPMQPNAPSIPAQNNSPGPINLGAPSGLGMPGATNSMGQRILTFNPATGGLE